MKIVHIVPLEDQIVHKYDISCTCQPNMQVSPTVQMAVHNALDCREEVEILGLATGRQWLTVALKSS